MRDACMSFFLREKKGGDSAIAHSSQRNYNFAPFPHFDWIGSGTWNQPTGKKKTVYKSLMFLLEGDVLGIPAMIFWGVDFVYQH